MNTKPTPTAVLSSQDIRFAFYADSGTFCIDRHTSPSPRLKDARACIEAETMEGRRFSLKGWAGAEVETEEVIQDVHGSGNQLKLVRREEEGLICSFLVRAYAGQPFLLVRITVQNHSPHPTRLHNITLLDCGSEKDGAGLFGAQPAGLDFFKTGWHDWVYSGLRHANQREVRTLIAPFVGKMLFNPANPIPWGKGDFWSDSWGILTDQKTAIILGLASTADQFGVLHARCSPGRNRVSLIAQADGIRLDPGEVFESEWGYIQFCDLPMFDPAADYVQAVARQMHARSQKTPPPAKWTHWYQFFQNVTEELFLENLDCIDKIRDVIPFRTVQLDDGYQSAWGDWRTTNAKFPHGLGYLANRVREKGFTPGLWLAPFVVDPRSRMAAEHPDWLVKDAKGSPITSGYFYAFFGNALDTSHPAVQEHIRSLLDTIVHEWGFGFVKTDFTYAAALPGIRYNPKMTRAQAYRKGMEAVRAGIGDETYLLGCGSPFGPCIGLVDAMRIGPDTAPNWSPFLWSMQWATPILKTEKSIGSLRNNMRHTLNLSTLHGQWWWNDPDCLMVRDERTNLTEEEIRSNLTLVGLSAGLLIHSDDITRLSPERQKLVALLTPTLGGEARPLDLLQHEMAEEYILPAKTGWGKWHNAAIFNWKDTAALAELDLTRLGYSEDETLHIFDFWKQAYRLHKGRILKLGCLPAHGCALLRITPSGEEPTLVGDSLHITQGLELATLVTINQELKLVTRQLGRRVEGKLWLSLDKAPQAAVCNDQPLKIHPAAEKIYALELNFFDQAEICLKL